MEILSLIIRLWGKINIGNQKMSICYSKLWQTTYELFLICFCPFGLLKALSYSRHHLDCTPLMLKNCCIEINTIPLNNFLKSYITGVTWARLVCWICTPNDLGSVAFHEQVCLSSQQLTLAIVIRKLWWQKYLTNLMNQNNLSTFNSSDLSIKQLSA